MEELVTQSFF